MGKFIITNPSKIIPSQDFLKIDTLEFIRKNFENGNVSALPPSPIVRLDDAGNLIAIDGHNLLAFYSAKNTLCEVYVANHNEDFLPDTTVMTKKRNADLHEKFDTVLEIASELKKRDIRSVEDLRKFVGYTLK